MNTSNPNNPLNNIYFPGKIKLEKSSPLPSEHAFNDTFKKNWRHLVKTKITIQKERLDTLNHAIMSSLKLNQIGHPIHDVDVIQKLYASKCYLQKNQDIPLSKWIYKYQYPIDQMLNTYTQQYHAVIHQQDRITHGWAACVSLFTVSSLLCCLPLSSFHIIIISSIGLFSSIALFLTNTLKCTIYRKKRLAIKAMCQLISQCLWICPYPKQTTKTRFNLHQTLNIPSSTTAHKTFWVQFEKKWMIIQKKACRKLLKTRFFKPQNTIITTHLPPSISLYLLGYAKLMIIGCIIIIGMISYGFHMTQTLSNNTYYLIAETSLLISVFFYCMSSLYQSIQGLQQLIEKRLEWFHIWQFKIPTK